MKIRIALLLILLLAGLHSTLAELFIGPSSPAHRLVLGADEAAILTGTFVIHDSRPTVRLIVGGETNSTVVYPQQNLSTALAGPMEIEVDGVAISFRRLTNSGIKTFMPKDGGTLHFEVPVGK